MTSCPHCGTKVDNLKEYITCPHCGRVAKSVDECVDILLSSGKIEGLRQKATCEYWETVNKGLRRIMFMDMETFSAVRDRLFKSPEETMHDSSSQ